MLTTHLHICNPPRDPQPPVLVRKPNTDEQPRAHLRRPVPQHAIARFDHLREEQHARRRDYGAAHRHAVHREVPFLLLLSGIGHVAGEFLDLIVRKGPDEGSALEAEEGAQDGDAGGGVDGPEVVQEVRDYTCVALVFSGIRSRRLHTLARQDQALRDEPDEEVPRLEGIFRVLKQLVDSRDVGGGVGISEYVPPAGVDPVGHAAILDGNLLCTRPIEGAQARERDRNALEVLRVIVEFEAVCQPQAELGTGFWLTSVYARRQRQYLHGSRNTEPARQGAGCAGVTLLYVVWSPVELGCAPQGKAVCSCVGDVAKVSLEARGTAQCDG